jgi:hypothetical protein
VSQVIEYLLCKCEALSSNPSPTKKKEKKKVLEAGHGGTCLMSALRRLRQEVSLGYIVRICLKRTN